MTLTLMRKGQVVCVFKRVRYFVLGNNQGVPALALHVELNWWQKLLDKVIA